MTAAIWYVAAGSAAGGVARFLLTGALQQRLAPAGAFPVGTLIVNITGSLLLGFALRWLLEVPTVSPEVRLLLTTGFCGGYTTFSTFSHDTVAMVDQGDWRRAALYVVLSVTLSLLAALGGIALARELIVWRRG
ncbi:MAG: fluoride efflux transporter CrcB [Gemmatimonadaceae bacterium]